MKTGEKTNFICDDWFSKEKGHTLVKDIPAKIRGREALDSKWTIILPGLKNLYLQCLSISRFMYFLGVF